LGNTVLNTKKIPVKRVIGKKFAKYPELGALTAFIVLFIIFSLLTERFASLLNLGGILSLISEIGLVVIGVTFLMISGEFDISVGSNYAVSAVTFGILLNVGVPAALAIFVSLIIGSFIGFINGIITLKLGIPSFIVTLGALMFWRGFVLGSSGGGAYVRYIGPNTPFIIALNQPFSGQFRTSLFWFFGILIIFYVILTKTKYGNSVYAVGGNPDAAKAMGINVYRVKLTNFIITGLLAGFAGCVSFARFKAVDPYMGKGMELESIAAAVIGGAALYGGFGSVIGSFIGYSIVAMIGSALVMIGIGAFWFQSVIGLILIVAVIINNRMRRLEKL